MSLSTFGGAGNPAEAVKNQIRQEAAIQNARQLKLNEHCFERCVPKPGSSLSSGETTCYTYCMEKYMAAWNTVSRQYVGRIQRDVGSQGLGGM
ncbi:protein translocase subunit [Taxawa tesnikishii (nom. ined.)]|nr:protein translocase subunit [Dothideales sp. JES 119]